MSDMMTQEEAINLLGWLKSKTNRDDDLEAIDMAIEALRHDVIFEQIKWERDVALETLEEHGIGFGQKAQGDISDLISRADAIEAIASLDETDGTVKAFTGRQVNEILSALPSAETPTESTNTQTNTPTVLISKEDAIDTICKGWCYVTFANCPHADDGFRCDGCDDVEAINALPSVEAVQRGW